MDLSIGGKGNVTTNNTTTDEEDDDDVLISIGYISFLLILIYLYYTMLIKHNIGIMIGIIMREFASLTNLTLALEAFTVEFRAQIQSLKINYSMETVMNEIVLKEIFENIGFSQVINYINEKDSICYTHINNNTNRYIDDIENKSYYPTTSLSKLLSSFKRNVDLEGDNIYFICDLHEKTTLASVIDHLSMNFRDRYLFCMAPVNIDDEKLMEFFVYLANEFTKGGDVYLPISTRGYQIPKSPTLLLELETIHKVSNQHYDIKI
jgi:hypothetical protein